MSKVNEIVQRLWGLCNDLRDDGVTFHQYVTELTYLLFLKMLKETDKEDQIPRGRRWDDLVSHNDANVLIFYRDLLNDLSKDKHPLAREIFYGANSFIRQPITLINLVSTIENIDWYDSREEGLGNIYEGLLEKNATEKKSGAGQYFTPRVLIDSIISVIKPSSEDRIQDPAAGTGGFLIAADHYIRKHEEIRDFSNEDQKKYYENTFYGMELVPDTHRLALMNLMLHGLAKDPAKSGIYLGDTLSYDHTILGNATLILSNPPFGSKRGAGNIQRPDIKFQSSNKQLMFLQHIYQSLDDGGRAAVILPDNVLSEGGIGRLIRNDLMKFCNVHTILRLPTGIFYAQGVKTNVIFFTKNEKAEENTEEVWIYDLRIGMPHFGKRSQLTRDYFEDFEISYGGDPWGGKEALAKRVDLGPSGRFRCFTREEIHRRNDSLDISWLESENLPITNLQEPVDLANMALTEMIDAIEELRNVLIELGEDENDVRDLDAAP